MKKVKDIFLLIIFLFILFLTKQKVYAESDWEKTSLQSIRMTVVESSPWGILAGEFDGNYSSNPPPIDGIYISRDFGKTWEVLGLERRAIKDIKYFDGKIYATTFYVINNTLGLFYSSDKGKTWNLIGPGYSPTKVDRNEKTIYLGTEHYGLWVSKDEGLTWSQKIGSGGDGTKIYEIESSKDIALTANLDRVYKSTDHGETWVEIPALYKKGIQSFCINGKIIFAGSSGNSGLFISRDLGNTWEWVQEFGNYPVNKIIYFEGKYYAGKYIPDTGKSLVIFTTDLGKTWHDTNLVTATSNRVLSLAGIFSDPSFIFSAVLLNGIYRYKIPGVEFSSHPFLDIPWDYENENELTDKITSYFDHTYPLLGYSYFTEPENESSTTLNFLGIKDTQPNIYYSSHSGTDFGLKYGTLIRSPASGYATYYYCKDCGNSIKIDHQNGYQTTYMHLQDDDLITKNGNIWVNNNDILGKVGLTGRTTGPHLHFEVIRDRELDGTFSNDFPMGRADPFGWQDTKNLDPWNNFSWTDSLGDHQGTHSPYLWNVGTFKNSQVIEGELNPQGNKFIILGNKIIEFLNPTEFFTTKIFSYIQPFNSTPTQILSYIKNTSFVIKAYDQIENEINNFENPISIILKLDPESLENINLESISLYFWNDVLNKWEIIPSLFDVQNNQLSSQINHLSWFAVFGEKIDYNLPETEIIVSGNQVDAWYTEFPQIEFTYSNDTILDIENTFYSLDYGDNWSKYLEPFYIQNDGIVDLIFKSQDVNGNMEKEKNQVLKINLYEKNIGRIKIINTAFNVSSEIIP